MDLRFETPILFLVFNRPDLTQKVFNQISKIKPSYLFIAADGPRSDRIDEFKQCQQTRAIIQQVDWDCEVRTLFRESNLGCGLAVNSAITWFFEQVEYGIILEDDCLPDLSFFPYCEELLIKYKDEEQIMLIGGTNFQNSITRGTASYYFSNYGHIWGWASWQRAWKKNNTELFLYDPKNSIGKLNHLFHSKTEKRYWNFLFSKCSKGKVDTWDYQWIYSIWENNGISITPNANLVRNIGLKGNSSHNFLNDSYKTELTCKEIKFPLVHPKKIKIDIEADLFTFENIYSHSFKRLLRILKENNIRSIFRYYIKKITSR